MDFLIRFAQIYETFRLPELEALAVVENVNMKVKSYSVESPFCIVTLPCEDSARRLIRRSLLTQTIHAHWATAPTLPSLLSTILSRPHHNDPRYHSCSFKFSIDSFQGTRSQQAKVDVINTFKTLPFHGHICMHSPDEHFTVFEQWPYQSFEKGITDPTQYHFGRLVGTGARDLGKRYNLKKRRWIHTTSMDAELALITANIALAAPGKIIYDPFSGTGGFPIACAHFGALSLGSDLDGRTMRGLGGEKSVRGNFAQYGLLDNLVGMFSADLTNTPVRVPNARRLFDAIVCDPPYGVREGLKVLGCKESAKAAEIIEIGLKKYREPSFVPPFKPYGFFAMLDDILAFAADTLVNNGRLSFWMPAVNDQDEEYPNPRHPCLEIISVCTQVFNKWSRRLITYRRIADEEVRVSEVLPRQLPGGTTADELNPFRRSYFTKFELS